MDSSPLSPNFKKHLLVLSTLSFLLFFCWSLLGFFVGEALSHEVLINSFGLPQGEQVFFFALVSGVSKILFFILGTPITLITMHQLGRRFKVAVGKPTFYGFLLYLLTLLLLILDFNRTH